MELYPSLPGTVLNGYLALLIGVAAVAFSAAITTIIMVLKNR